MFHSLLHNNLLMFLPLTEAVGMEQMTAWGYRTIREHLSQAWFIRTCVGGCVDYFLLVDWSICLFEWFKTYTAWFFLICKPFQSSLPIGYSFFNESTIWNTACWFVTPFSMITTHSNKLKGKRTNAVRIHTLPVYIIDSSQTMSQTMFRTMFQTMSQCDCAFDSVWYELPSVSS